MAQLNQLPASLEPIGTFGDKNVPVTMTGVWYKFFLSVSAILSNFVGGVLGFSLNNSVTATGGGQSTSKLLNTEWAVITAGANGTGVMLAGFGPGTVSTVFNQSGSPKNVYPPLGSHIEGLGVNNPYPLVHGKMQHFYQVGATAYLTEQPG